MTAQGLPWAVAFLAIVGCGRAPEKAAPAPLVCNGNSELCSRPYDAVAYPGTHDSYADTSENFAAPDQTYPVARQLEDGIRVLHFEVHDDDGGIFACHSLCEIGEERLTEEMTSVADFMQGHPSEVVTLLLERSDTLVTANQIGEAMSSVGLEPYLRTQAPGEPWPTLGEMIDGGERLVALLDNPDGGTYPWLLPRWNWTWETPWQNEVPLDFGRCNADRGTQGNSLYVVDTYLEDVPIESAAHQALINYDPFLIDRFLYCQQTEHTLPNFVMVDFYEASDVFHVVEVLNGFAAPPASIQGFPPSVFIDGGGVEVADGGLNDGGS